MFDLLSFLNDQNQTTRSLLFFAILTWSTFWKGISLWHAARYKQRYWFIALLITNTLGVLEIIFLAFFKKDKNNLKKNKK